MASEEVEPVLVWKKVKLLDPEIKIWFGFRGDIVPAAYSVHYVGPLYGGYMAQKHTQEAPGYIRPEQTYWTAETAQASCERHATSDTW